MKQLIYVLGFMFLGACVDKSKMQDLKGDIQNDLLSTYNNLDKAIKQEIKRIIQKYKPRVKRTQSESALKIITQTRAIEKKYLETLALLENNHTNKSYQTIFQNYKKWMLEKVKTHIKLEPINKIFKNDLVFTVNNTKNVIKLYIAQEVQSALYNIGFEFSSCGFDKMALLGSNRSQKIEVGNDIELQELLYYSANRIDKKYDYDTILINQGEIKKDYSIFNIAIPTQKIGKQEFEVVFKLKDWVTNQDTTLYFRENFEVTE